MYQYHNQSTKEEESTSAGADLFLLFDKYSGTKRSVSTPTSANVSPCMSDKECTDQAESGSDSFNPKSRRMSLNKAERRAEHNAIERARRECLNSKFQQLAEALPNLQNHRRPSKGQIVEKALDWVKQNMSKEDRYQYQIMQLQNENKRLLSQIHLVQDTTSSPVTAPFPASLRQQQYPANATPSAIDVSFAEHAVYYPQDTVYPNTTTSNMGPFNWQQPSSTEYLLPTATTSTSSLRFMQSEDDDESSSSGEEMHPMHIAYNDMAQSTLFDMNHHLGPSTSYKAQQGNYLPTPMYSHITYYS